MPTSCRVRHSDTDNNKGDNAMLNLPINNWVRLDIKKGLSDKKSPFWYLVTDWLSYDARNYFLAKNSLTLSLCTINSL